MSYELKTLLSVVCRIKWDVWTTTSKLSCLRLKFVYRNQQGSFILVSVPLHVVYFWIKKKWNIFNQNLLRFRRVYRFMHIIITMMRLREKKMLKQIIIILIDGISQRIKLVIYETKSLVCIDWINVMLMKIQLIT